MLILKFEGEMVNVGHAPIPNLGTVQYCILSPPALVSIPRETGNSFMVDPGIFLGHFRSRRNYYL